MHVYVAVLACNVSTNTSKLHFQLSIPAVWNPGFIATPPLETRTVLRYSFLNLTCQPPQQSIPPPVVTWNMVSDSVVGVAQDGRLVFSFVDGQNSVFECIVTNPVSRQNILSSRFTIREQLSIGGRMLKFTSKPGSPHRPNN